MEQDDAHDYGRPVEEVTTAPESLLFLALASALGTAGASRRGLAGAALLLGLAATLPVHAPCTLAAAVLVVADGTRVALPFALLGAAAAGLLAIAVPSAAHALAGSAAAAIVLRVAFVGLRSKLRPHRLFGWGARTALAFALCTTFVPAERSATLLRISSWNLAAACGLIAFALEHRAHAELAAKRFSRARSRARVRTFAHDESVELRGALQRIVHELRQPVGAASNALATAELPSTDAGLRDALRTLAREELASALAALESLARLSRAGVGDPLRLPLADAIAVAVAAHEGTVLATTDTAVSFEVDPAYFGHALDALISNARDAAPTSIVRVEGKLSTRADRVVVRVLDEGPEPDPVHLRRAAEPFFTTRAGRLGVGASAAAAYARAAGGALELRREGARTVAELALPLAAPRRTTLESP